MGFPVGGVEGSVGQSADVAEATQSVYRGGRSDSQPGIPSFEAGYEHDSLNDRSGQIRWWFYLHASGVRNQAARQGVVDRGFRFARGGRVSSVEEAEEALTEARAQAGREIRYWSHQPSHMLGPAGELIPLDEVIVALPESAG